MRGDTSLAMTEVFVLKNLFVILSEAKNLKVLNIKRFLTALAMTNVLRFLTLLAIQWNYLIIKTNT